MKSRVKVSDQFLFISLWWRWETKLLSIFISFHYLANIECIGYFVPGIVLDTGEGSWKYMATIQS